MVDPLSKVYRLRRIPQHCDRQAVAELVSHFLADGSALDVTVASLASSCEFWTVSPTRTATLIFGKLPTAVRDAPLKGEWDLQVLGLDQPLILDDQFYGFTALNDVSQHRHETEYACSILRFQAAHH
jgi:hypothetical protein